MTRGELRTIRKLIRLRDDSRRNSLDRVRMNRAVTEKVVAVLGMPLPWFIGSEILYVSTLGEVLSQGKATKVFSWFRVWALGQPPLWASRPNKAGLKWARERYAMDVAELLR